MKDLTLSGETFIPKGTHLSVLTFVIHHDSAVYENPGIFDDFRFSQFHDNGNENARHRMVTVIREYFPFGYGKRAWYGRTHLGVATLTYPSTNGPGRFLACNELKTMLVHNLASYEVKFEDSREGYVAEENRQLMAHYSYVLAR